MVLQKALSGGIVLLVMGVSLAGLSLVDVSAARSQTAQLPPAIGPDVRDALARVGKRFR